MKVFIVCLLIALVAAHNDEEDQLLKWRGAVQSLLMGVSRSKLPETFTPEQVAKRNTTVALNQQAGRWRAYVSRAIAQAVGDTVSMCPPLDISDQAVLAVRKELQELGWKVDFSFVGEHYSSADPLNMHMHWNNHPRFNECPGGRRAFRVEVPIVKGEKIEEE